MACCCIEYPNKIAHARTCITCTPSFLLFPRRPRITITTALAELQPDPRLPSPSRCHPPRVNPARSDILFPRRLKNDRWLPCASPPGTVVVFFTLFPPPPFFLEGGAVRDAASAATTTTSVHGNAGGTYSHGYSSWQGDKRGILAMGHKRIPGLLAADVGVSSRLSLEQIRFDSRALARTVI